ncbi:uncharacterized protein LOC120144851 [Hibiscus syriacus]|uniref:uncharacterized protein LOC120144851 n=1 Tax=Hibiscus syriacus TaxID=106335 RepID=UPI0019241D12|nr:uncharacterized protein LOC120144851 [Hibiscus syriacus]
METGSSTGLPKLDAGTGSESKSECGSIGSGSLPQLKAKKFFGENFKMWQQKMLFYLTTMNLSKFLKEDPSVFKEGEGEGEGEVDNIIAFNIVNAWKHIDYICRNIILNSLSDSLYLLYVGYETTKRLCKALDHKYKVEDVGVKKFLVAKFLNFTMVASKPVVKQVEELQLTVSGILAERMVIDKSF